MNSHSMLITYEALSFALFTMMCKLQYSKGNENSAQL